jgi:hypothetical protein
VPMMVTGARRPQAHPGGAEPTFTRPAASTGRASAKTLDASDAAARGRYVSGGSHRQLSAMRLLCALVPLLYLAAVGAWSGLDEVVARLANDDQSYYILVARNLFERGPTYDGASLTNGVHPLFTLLLGAVYQLPIGFSELAAASVITCVTLGGAFLYVLLGIRPSLPGTRVALVSLLSSLAVYPILYRGMEGALALLVMASYLSAIARRGAPLVWLSLLSLMLWAARLELIVFAPIATLIAGSSLRLERAERKRLWLGWLVSLLGFGAYALASYRYIGLALPVSGLIKQASPVVLPIFCAFGGAALLGSLGLARLARDGGPLRGAWMTRSVLAFSAVFYLSHAAGQADIQQQTWYYFPLPALLACGLLELELELGPALRRAAAVACVTLGVAATCWEVGFVIPLRAESWRGMAAVATRAKHAASPGERFMGPGWMSLLVGPEFEPFSQDGLVGGAEQYRALREGRALEYAYDHGVRFMFAWSPSSAGAAPPVLPPPWQLQLVSSGEVPTGRSLWASLLGDTSGCGLGRCNSSVSVYRLSVAPHAVREP